MSGIRGRGRPGVSTPPAMYLAWVVLSLILVPGKVTGSHGPAPDPRPAGDPGSPSATVDGAVRPDPDPSGAQVVRAARLPGDASIRIDGFVDEEAWELAEPITDFRQQDPVEGAQPSERTEIRILYDRDALYIGAIFYESDPSGIVAFQRERNAGLGTDDRFMWILDTFRDGRTGYFFEINPAGLMGDGLIGVSVNKSWDGIWEVRTQILDHGWSAEIRIPFSTLNFDPTLEAWGINFQRTIRRRNEEIVWSGWRRNQPLTRPVHAGLLTGIEGISQGIGLELKPYAVGATNQTMAVPGGWDSSAKVGLDASYSITPNLRAAVTLNTDFAEVEVDQRRVNLTRFPLFFPERRDFFLEGSGVFSFAARQGAFPFFSRRIGLVEGQEVPIHVGARLTGQVGRNELGFYQVRTGSADLGVPGDEGLRPAEDFTVTRIKRALFEQSHMGAIYTRRSTGADGDGFAPPDRHTVGLDLDLFTSRLLGEYNAQFEAFFIHHTDPVVDGSSGFADRRARGIRVSFPNDRWRFHSSLRDFGTHYAPATGFASRNGFRRLQPTLTWAPRPDWWSAVRQMEWQIQFEYLTDLENRLLTRNIDLTLLQLNFESGDRFGVEVGERFERLDQPFRIHGSGDDAIHIPAGDYRNRGWSTQLRTAGRRAVSGGVELGRRDFWSGERTEIQGNLTARPWPGVSFSTMYQRNEVRLPQGDFDTNLVRLGANWNPSPLTSFTGNVQYDDVSEVVGLFLRARWIVRPGNDLFLVWTHNWRNQGGSLLDRNLDTLSRGGALKVNYTYRL